MKSLGANDVSKKEDFGGIIDDISMLEYSEKVSYERNEQGLKIYSDVCSDKPITFKLELK